MQSNTTEGARSRQCPLCGTPLGQPCQPRPEGDHLARYLDAVTAGELTREYMLRVLGELVVIDYTVVVPNGTTRGQQLYERWWAAMSGQGIECEPWEALPHADRAAWEAVDDGDVQGEKTAKLARVRAVVDAFDWGMDDRQYALERIDEIVNGRPW